MMKFHGDLESLRAAVGASQFVGEWTEEGKKHCFRAKTGAILNWWPSTGTLQFQPAIGTARPRSVPLARLGRETRRRIEVRQAKRAALFSGAPALPDLIITAPRGPEPASQPRFSTAHEAKAR
jgi:hypothetical protein